MEDENATLSPSMVQRLRFGKKMNGNPQQNQQDRAASPSRVALAAAGLGGLRESLFAVLSAGTSRDIEFTLPPSNTPPFVRRSPNQPGAPQQQQQTEAAACCGDVSPRAISPGPSPCARSPAGELRGVFPLGSLNPALYKRAASEDGDDVGRWGRVHFALSYAAPEERLHILLRRASGLPAASQESADVCLPSARLCLLPDERRYLQTHLRKRTSNPHFNEEFCFHVAQRTMAERSLRITFYDLERRQLPVGQVTLALKDFELNAQQLDVQLEIAPPGAVNVACPGPCKGPREVGVQLLAALNFGPALQRLTVSVLEARVAQTCVVAECDMYARVSLVQQARAVKTKRTATAKHVSAPGMARFDESFSFHVALAALDTCSLAVHLIRPGAGLAKDTAIGRIVLGSHMFAKGSGLEHWKRMIASPTERVQQWHCLVRD